ncbi:unnamed protein product [Paramecium primaurelia]|uniref:Uncharacterized protein n=2 Tax=Paramecium primaurelia TaxID=5886 RepID=A0A8S1QKY7_PARPR|nr:unnamed protein product [Paramecium primaurelia]
MEQEVGKICLVEVPVEKTFLFQDQITIDKNLTTLREGLSYRLAQSFMHPQQKLFIVCPPSYALKELDTKINNKTLFDGKGYIKAVPKADYPSLVGQQSGMRSAIIQQNGKRYRLKGCGNGNDGFTLRKFEGDIENAFEIRGCCFDHTVKRELFMNRKIEQILKKYNIETGNISIGYWQYGDIESINQNLEKNLQNQIPLVPKYCGIYETIGDFRLGTHLLQGLRLIVNSSISDWCVDDIRRLVTVQSRIVENRKSQNGNPWDLNNTQYRERPEGTILQEDDYQNNRVFDWEKEKDNISIIENLIGNSMLQNISILYQRIGYEVGKIKRIFIDNDISWGYFRDHSKFYYHSNAHLDNFVIIQNGSNVLAPVDFDLAFCKEEFINIDIDFDAQRANSSEISENKNYGKFDLEQWLFYQEQERIGLELAIGGMDMILASHMFIEKQKTDVEEFFEILLRDQMRIGYLEGMQLKEDSSLFYQRMDKIQDIIKEALNQTQQIVS